MTSQKIEGMDGSIKQAVFKEALNLVGKSINNKSVVPILANVHLQTIVIPPVDSERPKMRLVVSGTNLVTGIRIAIPAARITKEGATTMPYRTLNSIVGLMVGTVDINLDSARQKLKLKSGDPETARGTSKANIKGLAASEYPTILNYSNAEAQGMSCEIEPNILEQALIRTVFSTDKTSGRPTLEGVYFENKGGTLTFASADGFRMSVQKTTAIVPDDWPSFIVPRDSLIALQSVVANATDPITIVVNKQTTQVAFVVGDIQIISQLISGNFPDYVQIIPPAHTTEAEFSCAGLKRAVDQAQVFSKHAANLIQLEILETSEGMEDGARIIVTGKSAETGDQVAQIPAEVTGNPSNAALNGLYLAEFLSAVNGRIVLTCTNELSPLKFGLKNDPSYIHVVMPMHKG